MINISNDAAAVSRTPELSTVYTQAVQAGDMALRRGLAALESDRIRRQDQVPASELGPGAEALDPRAPSRRGERGAARRKPQAAPGQAPGTDPPLPAHRIDLVA
jgi:hypothetical protein